MLESNEKLVEDVKKVLLDLEMMLGEVKDKTSNEINDLHTSMSARLATAKSQLIDAEQDLLTKKQIATKMTNQYVHKNAWTFIYIAAVASFLIGYVM